MTPVTAPLGEIADLRAGVGFPLNFQGKTSGKYPLAKVGDISRAGRSGTSMIGAADHYVDDVDLQHLGGKPIPPGSILFAKIGEAMSHNHRVVTTVPMLIDNNAMAAIPDLSRVVPRYLYHVLKTIDFYRLSAGKTVPSIRKSVLQCVPIPLPPLAQQKRIAAVLDKADDLRAKRRHALATLDTLLQSVFLDMFGDFKDKQWPRRPFESMVASTQLGLVRSSEQFGDAFALPYIRMNAITASGELDHTVVKRTEATTAEVAQCSLTSGDLLFNTRNSRQLVGKTAIFEGSGVHLFNNNVMRIRFTREVDPYFVLHYLHTPVGDSSLEVIKAGTTSVFAIYWSKLKSLELPVPPVTLQAAFRSIAAAIETKRAQMRSCLAQFESLFTSLQSAAFAGNLFERVSGADEPIANHAARVGTVKN